MRAILPETIEPERYHKNYVMYVGNALKAAGVEVDYRGSSTVQSCGFHQYRAELDGRPFIIDYNDYKDVPPCTEPDLPRFKFSYSREHLPPDGHLFPFSPISFLDWDQFERMKQEVHYDATGDRILFVQSLHRTTPCYERRKLLRKIIPEAFGGRVDMRMLPLEDYWRQINTCLVRVFAPGSRNDMLDRGHAQHMAFGCCTISPPLATVLPWYRPLVPGTHYVACKPDYSDVVEKIRWCDEHREECREVGHNAEVLFRKWSMPGSLAGWLSLRLSVLWRDG